LERGGIAVTLDKDFFNELRSIIQSDLGAIIPESIRPRVSELKSARLVSQRFAAVLETLIKKLHKKRKNLIFNADFIAYPGHICTFPDGRAFRRQLNIGFFASDDPDFDSIRFGLGFSINKNYSQAGVDEYNDFLVKVLGNPDTFNQFFCEVGGYAEPEFMNSISPMPLSIQTHTPVYTGDWRIFGNLLTWKDDCEIISNMDLLVEEMVRVFDLIARYGY
jgi:hypothetical protein